MTVQTYNDLSRIKLAVKILKLKIPKTKGNLLFIEKTLQSLEDIKQFIIHSEERI